MLYNLDGFINNIMPLGVFLLVFAVSCLVRNALFRRLSAWQKKSPFKVNDIVVSATRIPSILWCLMLGLGFSLDVSQFPDGLSRFIGKAMLALGISSVSLALAHVSTRLIESYYRKRASIHSVSSLTQNVTRITIYGLGLLIILNSLGISVTPILATLGVGGLAVALALQDTLSNLFAGFNIMASGQVKIGDYIRLESGQEGYVADINWRVTKIRLPSDVTVMTPNSKLTQAAITNYNYPARNVEVVVEAPVGSRNDLGRVERICLETAAQAVKDVPGAIPDFSPVFRFVKFSRHGIFFTVTMQTQHFTGRDLLRHEFIKRLHARFIQEGIVFSGK